MWSVDGKTRDVQPTELNRREALGRIGGICAVVAATMLRYRRLLVAAVTASGAGTVAGASCAPIPQETAGPFPADGSNRTAAGIANALLLPGIVRSDIRSSLAGATGVARGVPLKLTLELVDARTGCTPLSGYAIYLWHCDAVGRYSMYTQGVGAENYLRGVQISDAKGLVSFTTIVPGCYGGRMPHMHFEVYRDQASTRRPAGELHTSQLSFPLGMLDEVYASADYRDSAANLARTSFASDPVFSDGHDSQTCRVSGNVATGYAAVLKVGVAV
ncbi:MAG TPA: intradiol ring-cleavage dioxygenase [Rhodocyclaceae bacterium]|nr:intradiol ring-cleavage dioxygenase [Rhodocyclaceae bacterium]